MTPHLLISHPHPAPPPGTGTVLCAPGDTGPQAAAPDAAAALAALHGLTRQCDLHPRWLAVCRRMITYRARIQALDDLRTTFELPVLDGPTRERLTPAGTAVWREWWGEVCRWATLGEQVLDSACSITQGTGTGVAPLSGDGYFPAETSTPLDTGGNPAEPRITLTWSWVVLPPVVTRALEQLADIEATSTRLTERYADAPDGQPGGGTGSGTGSGTGRGGGGAAEELMRVRQFPAALLAFGDAAVMAIAAELRSALLSTPGE